MTIVLNLKKYSTGNLWQFIHILCNIMKTKTKQQLHQNLFILVKTQNCIYFFYIYDIRLIQINKHNVILFFIFSKTKINFDLILFCCFPYIVTKMDRC